MLFDTRSPSLWPAFPAKALLTNQGGEKDAESWLNPRAGSWINRHYVSAVLNQMFWSRMLCKGSSLLVTEALQWLQWHTQTLRGHPDSCPLLLLVLLVSWKQEHSMICPFHLQWCFSLSFFAPGSLSRGPQRSIFNLRSTRPAWCWGGHTYLLRASRESQPTAPYVQRQKNPSHYPFLVGKAFGEDGLTAGGSALCKHVGRRNEAGGIQTPATSGPRPQCDWGRGRRAEKQNPADCFRSQLCFPIWHPLLPQSCGLHLLLFSCGNTAFKAISEGSVVAMMSLPACLSHLQLSSFWQSGKSQGDSCSFGRFILLLHEGSLSKQQDKISGKRKQQKELEKEVS